MPNMPQFLPDQLKDQILARLSDVIIAEVGRSRARIAELKRIYPSAPQSELAERLADGKKNVAATSGAISGIFGIASVPMDFGLITYLQLSVMIDVACLNGVNLKPRAAQRELIDLLLYVNGVDPLVRAGPRLLGHAAFTFLKVSGLKQTGRVIPVVASPVTAWLNGKAIQRACHEAMVFYGQERPTSSSESSKD